MKYWFLGGLLACSSLFAEGVGPQPKNLKLDQVDTTDTFAIPLDTSDVEDEVDIENMQEEQKEYFKKHPEAYQEWLKKQPRK